MTPIPSDTLDEFLRKSGLRPTRQRSALAELLFAEGNRHVTAEQLHSEAGAAGVSVSLATIYNTLNQFTEAGLLREVVVESGRSYFDTNIDDHHHFFMVDTGQLVDIPGVTFESVAMPMTPVGHAVERVDVIIRLRSPK